MGQPASISHEVAPNVSRRIGIETLLSAGHFRGAGHTNKASTRSSRHSWEFCMSDEMAPSTATATPRPAIMPAEFGIPLGMCTSADTLPVVLATDPGSIASAAVARTWHSQCDDAESDESPDCISPARPTRADMKLRESAAFKPESTSLCCTSFVMPAN